jgi:hypothetical protein
MSAKMQFGASRLDGCIPLWWRPEAVRATALLNA